MAEIISIKDIPEESLNSTGVSLSSQTSFIEIDEVSGSVAASATILAETMDQVDKAVENEEATKSLGERQGPEGEEFPGVNTRTATVTIAPDVMTNDNDSQPNANNAVLPWAVRKERMQTSAAHIDPDIKPGEYIMRTLFAEFVLQVDKKITSVMTELLERVLSKSLQRGEDAQFDQLLSAFGSVAEHCLPSLLRTLFAWFERQRVEFANNGDEKKKLDPKKNAVDTPDKTEHEYIMERRDLALEFILCLVLIEVLKQLPVHPGHEDLIGYIENLAFKHFKYKEGVQNSPNAVNIHVIADLYAEVLGVLAQSRFLSVRKRFMSELKELRAKEPSPCTTQSIIALLMGMKFFRVKMVPIEEFEASFQFMQECGQYFLEVKEKDIKHALAGLFVEILVPVAATVKHEVNVPCLKNFVEMLYSHTLDLATKNKHRLALFPLVTCLLCVSQKIFFLQNWHYFLAMCLSHLKNRDPQVSRVALESLYRLLWVYMIRIKCESNSATLSRLHSIVNSLFPKGSKSVVPRDTPLNIFVKIIQFIAQERLDFAMREIVFDLLSVGRPVKFILTPERMSIGLRAFLVIADSLQKKEGEPPMPRTVGVLPSGNTLRIKKTFLNKMLTEDAARSIGMSSYYPYVRKVFNGILRALDAQFGRPLMMTNVQNVNKEPDEMISGERKPKIDLFRTCIAAVPRLIPDGMSRGELIELLARMTVHMDEELRGLAFQSLQTLVLDFPAWRDDVIYGYIQFVVKEVYDTFPSLLDNGLRILLQLLTGWRNAVSSVTNPRSGSALPDDSQKLPSKSETGNVLHATEGFALVMLCHSRLPPRRVSTLVLKETKLLLKALGLCSKEDQPVIDAIDRCCPAVVEKCLPLLPSSERSAIQAANCIDLQWLSERSSSVWTPGIHEDSNMLRTASLQNLCGSDPWSACVFGFLEKDRLLTQCVTAVAHAWPIVYARLHLLYSVVDPTPVNDNRASLLRSSTTVKKPVVSERDLYMPLWKNYVSFACRVVPPISNPILRCASPDISLSSSPDSLMTDRSDSRLSTNGISPTGLYKLLVPLLRCETTDMRDAVVHALGILNHEALRDLLDELLPYVREALDRKQGNVRRQKRRDALRLQLVRMMELIADKGTFGYSGAILDRDNQTLYPVLLEFIEGMRQCLEADTDKDSLPGKEIRSCFANFLSKLICCFSLEIRPMLMKRDLRRQLFTLFASWSGKFGRPFGYGNSGSIGRHEDTVTELELTAVQAMSTVLCCGPCFDNQGLAEDGYLYAWLDILLGSHHEKIYKLAQETVVLLLEFNPDMSPLLDWVVDRCYTGTPEVADGCFLALATIFSAREYPCDHYTAIINVTLMSTGCPRTLIHETALQLLQLLDLRFFGTVAQLSTDMDDDVTERGYSTLDALLSATYSRSQLYLSRQLAQLHPELTMPMFSEITHRLQTARFTVRQLLLRYLLPWLCNMELVDPNLTPATPLTYIQYYTSEIPRSGFAPPSTGRKEGWGSAEATEMVLNNLFYITAKFGDDHPKEIEDVWAELCACWPTNLRVILRYVFIVAGMAPQELLPYGKRVVLYLGRARPERLLDEIMNELQTMETMACMLERTETPPFFRVTSLRKVSSHWDAPDSANNAHSGGGTNKEDTSGLAVEKGVIHTKRHSGEDPLKESLDTSSIRSGKGLVSNSNSLTVGSNSPRLEKSIMEESKTESELENISKTQNGPEPDSYDVPQPHPLPMPEYGGYFAPLTEFLPDSSQPINGFHRCNLAVMLLVELVVDGMDGVDWSIHLPLMLHMAVLGLDHSRPLVAEHCKLLLLNLLVVLAEHGDHLTVARVLLHNKTEQLGYGLVTPPLPIVKHCFTESEAEFDSFLQGPCLPPSSLNLTTSSESKHSEGSNSDVDTESSVDSSPEEMGHQPPPQPGPDMPLSDVIKSLIDFLASRPGQSLWSYEDITSKVWTARSADQLDLYVQYIVRVFGESLLHSHLEERWAQVALQLGLSSPSRHYAGRSLQVFRALRVPVTSRMLSDILSRLVETAAEQGEDMQGYVTELILTLESAVESLDTDFRPMDVMKEIFKSTPNLHKETAAANTSVVSYGGALGRRHAFYGGVRSYLSAGQAHQGHVRSTSHSAAYVARRSMGSPVDGKDGLRCRSGTDADRGKSSNLSRSRSAQSLKALEGGAQEDKLVLLAQLFWIAVCLLESDYEHEFLLALRLLERVLNRLPLDRPDCRDKVEKLLPQLKWNTFPGVHGVLLKGCTNPNTYEATLNLLSQFTLLLDICVIDPTQTAFPINVMALLPYMVLNYEDATPLCIRSAENIAQVSTEKTKKLENLATVMTLYSRRTFSKESFQWTKCVVKYLHDTYASMGVTMLAFLVEVLEKGPSSVQLPILSIIHCMLHYVDVSVPVAAPQINAELLRVIAKYVDGPHWKEALKILKLVVTRSSSLVAPPVTSSSGHSSLWGDTPSGSSSFGDSELFAKKELPGRTMEFTYDLSQTPVIGRKLNQNASAGTENQQQPKDETKNADKKASKKEEEGACSPRRSVSLSSADSSSVSGWKRPWLSQARVRESLVNLLTSCGQKVGLPKSPSWVFFVDRETGKVIFSQSSELLERQSSMASSTEEMSTQQDLSGDSKLDDSVTTDQQFGVFKDFDFLEYELESEEGESLDRFNWGVHRHSLNNLDTEGDANTTAEATPVMIRKPHRVEESSDDELGSVSPLDDVITGGGGIPRSDSAGGLSGGGSSSSAVIFPPTSLPLDLGRRHSSIHSDSSHSECSEGDLGDVTPCNLSPGIGSMQATPPTFRPITVSLPSNLTLSSADDPDHQWRQLLQNLVSSSPTAWSSSLLSAFPLFNNLYKDLRVKVSSVSRECCHYLSMCQGPGKELLLALAVLFQNGAQMLVTGVDCPTILCVAPADGQLPVEGRAWERLRFAILELQEHYETCFDRREHALECLGLVQSTLKLQQMGETFSEQTCDEQHIDLCRLLYKLQFQALMLLESFAKLLGLLSLAASGSQMMDISEDINSLRTGLYQALEEVELDPECGTPTPKEDSREGESLNDTSLEGSRRQDVEYHLLELLLNKRLAKALRVTRQQRSVWPSGTFGNTDDEEISAILKIYALYIANKNTLPVWSIAPGESVLQDACSSLMDINIQIQSSLRYLEKSLASGKESRERSDFIKRTDC